MSGDEMRDSSERLKAVRERLREAGLWQPWFDVCKNYDFPPLFPPEQMRWLATPEARWARPALSLEAYLRGQKQKGG